MLPSIKNKLDRELGKAAKDIEDKVAPQDDKFPRYTVLPARGFSEEEMTSELERYNLSHQASVAFFCPTHFYFRQLWNTGNTSSMGTWAKKTPLDLENDDRSD